MKVVEIVFDNSYLKNEKIYCPFNNDNITDLNSQVIVNVNDNYKIGRIHSIKEVNKEDLGDLSNKIIRKVTKKDLQKDHMQQKEAVSALEYAKSLSKKLKLNMNFLDSYYTFDKKQLFLSYVAENRIDFRELAKLLAQKYKTRIELRQIGVRDKAKKVGGIGPCGLSLCCTTFLNDFNSVSINMAKNQFLSLNPTKINGLCGRLLCCLNYENEVYTELKKDMPEVGQLVELPEGLGKIVSIDIFKRSYKAEIKDQGIVEVKVNND